MPETATRPAEAAAQAKSPYWVYKGHPLVRCGDTIYYGSLADDYVVMLKISSTKEIANRQGGESLRAADKVNVWLMNTDPDLSPMDRIVQRCERRGLYDAVDVASVWLERHLKKAA